MSRGLDRLCDASEVFWVGRIVRMVSEQVDEPQEDVDVSLDLEIWVADKGADERVIGERAEEEAARRTWCPRDSSRRHAAKDTVLGLNNTSNGAKERSAAGKTG